MRRWRDSRRPCIALNLRSEVLLCQCHVDRGAYSSPLGGVSMTGKLTLAPIVLMTCLAGCVTVACDPDDPTFGKDCYECTREATIEAEHTQDGRGRIKEQTERCLRERGYTKKK